MTNTIPLTKEELLIATESAKTHNIPLSRVYKAINAFSGDVIVATQFLNALKDEKTRGILRTLATIDKNIHGGAK